MCDVVEMIPDLDYEISLPDEVIVSQTQPSDFMSEENICSHSKDVDKGTHKYTVGEALIRSKINDNTLTWDDVEGSSNVIEKICVILIKKVNYCLLPFICVHFNVPVRDSRKNLMLSNFTQMFSMHKSHSHRKMCILD